MFLRSQPLELTTLHSIMVAAPHPDDETLGAGGTIARLARQGAKIAVVIVSDGGDSHPNHPIVSRERLIYLRKNEALSALSKLGVTNVTFVGAPDGKLAVLQSESRQNTVEIISTIVQNIRPQIVLMPSMNDGTSDHEASFALVRDAILNSKHSPRILEFPIWGWRRPKRLIVDIFSCRTIWRASIKEVQDTKSAAIAEYRTQTEAIAPNVASVLSPDFVQEFVVNDEFFFER